MISIIIPTYNERKNISGLVKEISELMKNYEYEIVVVDDDSPDMTIHVLKSLSETIPLVPILRKGKRDLSKSILFKMFWVRNISARNKL